MSLFQSRYKLVEQSWGRTNIAIKLTERKKFLLVAKVFSHNYAETINSISFSSRRKLGGLGGVFTELANKN